MARAARKPNPSRTAPAVRWPLPGIGRRLGTSRSGNVGMLFAMMVVPMTAVIGMSVDYGRALSQRTELQSAIDSAVLAAGRTYQTTGDTAAAERAALDHLETSVGGRMHYRVTRNSIDTATNTSDMRVAVTTPTTFLGLLGAPTIEVTVASSSTLALGGIDTDLEVALALDITGSMAGRKIDALKDAATDLVDILVQDDQSEHRSRVALVPFSETVNPGDLLERVREPSESGTAELAAATFAPGPSLASLIEQLAPVGPAFAGNGHGRDDDEEQSDSNGACGQGQSLCERITFTDNDGHQQTWRLSDCVSERAGAHAFTDTAPNGQHYLGPVYTADGRCQPSQPVVPLTSDKDRLEDEIDDFRANGWTAGHLGTAWAYYMLSPKWANILPAASAPANFHDGGTMKVAVIMTDGVYNTQYNQGIMDRFLPGNRAAPNGSSAHQAAELCEAMKQDGITVYTVGFQLDDEGASEMLRDCASSPTQAYRAENGDQLRMAFREIGFSISQLRLSR